MNLAFCDRQEVWSHKMIQACFLMQVVFNKLAVPVPYPQKDIETLAYIDICVM